MSAHAGQASAWAFGVLVAIALGASVALAPQIAFGLLCLLLAFAATQVPVTYWVIGAIVAALTFKGLFTLGALPASASFVDIPLVWAALGLALAKTSNWSPQAVSLLKWLAGLAVACAVSWAFHPSDLVRPLAYFLLLAQPFAVTAALLVDQPDAASQRHIRIVLAALIALQVPLAMLQAASSGLGDPVQGTLYGAGAGAHVMSAVVVIGLIWLVASKVSGRAVLAIPMLFVPFLAEARTVLFALPIAFITLARRRRAAVLLTILSSVLLAVVLYVPSFTSVAYVTQIRSSFNFFERIGDSGKVETAQVVWNEVATSPDTLAFGLGPAQTVSRAAFLTIESYRQSGSALQSLGVSVAPARIAAEAEAAAQARSGRARGSSANSGQSSALGVLGDLGLFGMAIYGGLIVWLIVQLWRRHSPEAIAAAGGFILFAALGVVYDWWEQPPLGVPLGVLAGLALTSSRES